jgi:hypothetical protein
MPPFNRTVTIKGKSSSIIPGTKEIKFEEKIVAEGIHCRIGSIIGSMGSQDSEKSAVGKMSFFQEFMFTNFSNILMNAIIVDEKTNETWVAQGTPVDPAGKNKLFIVPVQKKQI